MSGTYTPPPSGACCSAIVTLDASQLADLPDGMSEQQIPAFAANGLPFGAEPFRIILNVSTFVNFDIEGAPDGPPVQLILGSTSGAALLLGANDVTRGMAPDIVSSEGSCFSAAVNNSYPSTEQIFFTITRGDDGDLNEIDLGHIELKILFLGPTPL